MQAYTYLAIDIACVTIPFIASFYSPHPFYKSWPSFFKASCIVAVLFLIWDQFFTVKEIWGFNPDYLTGLYLGDLPLEEVLFFFCIPYACVFTYFALGFLIRRNPLQYIHSYISLILILILGTLAAFYIERAYTAVTFISLSIYLLVCLFLKKDISFNYLSYLTILPFFFASNGLLTGSLLESPIVWYSNAENLGIRMGTIPFEDTFYGFLLVTLNIDLYRYFESKR